MYKSFAYYEKVKSPVLPLSTNYEGRWERNYSISLVREPAFLLSMLILQDNCQI